MTNAYMGKLVFLTPYSNQDVASCAVFVLKFNEWVFVIAIFGNRLGISLHHQSTTQISGEKFSV